MFSTSTNITIWIWLPFPRRITMLLWCSVSCILWLLFSKPTSKMLSKSQWETTSQSFTNCWMKWWIMDTHKQPKSNYWKDSSKQNHMNSNHHFPVSQNLPQTVPLKQPNKYRMWFHGDSRESNTQKTNSIWMWLRNCRCWSAHQTISSNQRSSAMSKLIVNFQECQIWN